MFSRAVSVGIRLNVWKMKPTFSRRSTVSSFSESVVRSTSPMNTLALAGRVQARHAVEQRGLAGARGPHDRRVPAPLERDGDPVERSDGRVALAVDLRECLGPGGRVDAGVGRCQFIDRGHARSPSGRLPSWARQVLNLRPLACEASALPLSYAPERESLTAAPTPSEVAKRRRRRVPASRRRQSPSEFARTLKGGLCTRTGGPRKPGNPSSCVARLGSAVRQRRWSGARASGSPPVAFGPGSGPVA